jgi:hypothetical protein
MNTWRPLSEHRVAGNSKLVGRYMILLNIKKQNCRYKNN